MKSLISLVAIVFFGIIVYSRLPEAVAFRQDRIVSDVETGTPAPSRQHPAIAYTSRPLNDPVTDLNRKIQKGEVRLEFDNESGYLRSILNALKVPIESQVTVFSKTSLQSERIDSRNPRAIFFNDSVAVAKPRNGFIEIASTDPQQGVVFFSFGQFGRPEFRRDEGCLVCHTSAATLRVPGLALGSVFTGADGMLVLDAPTFVTDHRSPLEQRWGGWYVTGRTGVRHLGNRVVTDLNKAELSSAPQMTSLESLKGTVDLTGYLSPYSDVVALMVLAHQAHMTNLITRIGWESRIASHERVPAGTSEENARRLESSAREFVDYLLFIDEAALPVRLQGTSGFAETFQLLGPIDSKGRSLRQLDLEQRLMRYPCSYMIYSAAFDGMPTDAREAIYQRMWQVLSGKEPSQKYARFSLADRRAIVEILRETKKGLPSYFGQIPR